MNITIIGGGWLGQPLAKHLIRSGHNVVATRRSKDGVFALGNAGIKGICYTLGDDLTSNDLIPLFQADVLIINIPPGRKTLEPTSFIANMRALIEHAKQCQVSKLLFVSTSAVYGNNTRVVYEYSDVDPQTDSAKVHVAIEEAIRHLFKDNGSILRLSGLVSEDRHPARFLSGRKQIENGQQLINLIHREDVIAAISAIIEQQRFGHTLHLSATAHPSRRDYYQDAARRLNITEPEFIDAIGETGKQINADLTLKTLNLTLKYPSPYDMLPTQQ